MDVVGNAVLDLRNLSRSTFGEGKGLRGGEVNFGFRILDFDFVVPNPNS